MPTDIAQHPRFWRDLMFAPYGLAWPLGAWVLLTACALSGVFALILP